MKHQSDMQKTVNEFVRAIYELQDKKVAQMIKKYGTDIVNIAYEDPQRSGCLPKRHSALHNLDATGALVAVQSKRGFYKGGDKSYKSEEIQSFHNIKRSLQLAKIDNGVKRLVALAKAEEIKDSLAKRRVTDANQKFDLFYGSEDRTTENPLVNLREVEEAELAAIELSAGPGPVDLEASRLSANLTPQFIRCETPPAELTPKSGNSPEKPSIVAPVAVHSDRVARGIKFYDAAAGVGF